MATNPINLVDAIVVATGRNARNRTAVLRTGIVRSVVRPWCYVQVGTSDPAVLISAGYHSYYTPAVGDIVDLINDGDRWVVLGAQVGP